MKKSVAGVIPTSRRRGTPSLAGVCLGACLAAISFTASAETLTLADALTRAGAASPAQRAAAARIDAAEAAARQAAVKPNPTLGLDIENLGSQDSTANVDRTETTLYYQQSIERGGKRQARTQVASRQIDIARAQLIVTQLDFFETIEKQWAEALAAQTEAALAERRLAIAITAGNEVKRRVDAARDPLFAGTQVETEIAEARLDLDQAKARALNARQALATYWGGVADFDMGGPDMPVPSLSTVMSAPATSPDLQLLEAERERATAEIRLEQTRARHDVSVRGGVRYFSGSGDAALILGGSIPLGVNDTNRGNIERAQSGRIAAEADIEARRLERLRKRSRLLSSLSLNLQEVARIDADVLPPARKTLELVSEGYNRGGFRHTDVIAAARAIAAIEARRIAVLKATYFELAELNRLDGRHAGLVAHTDIQP
jgi:outer membrane protein, heavy metal efflux system